MEKPEQYVESVQLTIKTPERHCSIVFIVNSEHITQIVLMFPLKILNK